MVGSPIGLPRDMAPNTKTKEEMLNGSAHQWVIVNFEDKGAGSASLSSAIEAEAVDFTSVSCGNFLFLASGPLEVQQWRNPLHPEPKDTNVACWLMEGQED
jgi:hypothetical protein